MSHTALHKLEQALAKRDSRTDEIKPTVPTISRGDPRGPNVFATPTPPRDPTAPARRFVPASPFEITKAHRMAQAFDDPIPQPFGTGLGFFGGTAGSTAVVAPSDGRPRGFVDTALRQVTGGFKGIGTGLGALTEKLVGGVASTVTGRGFSGDPVNFSFPANTSKEDLFIRSSMTSTNWRMSPPLTGADPQVIRDIASRTFDLPKSGPINDPVMLKEMAETREAKRLLKMARSFARQPGTGAEAIMQGIFSFGTSQPPLTPNEISRMHPALALLVDITSASPLGMSAGFPTASVLSRTVLPQATTALKGAVRTGAVDVGRFSARLLDPLTDPVTAQLGGGRFLRLVPDPDPNMAKTVQTATQPLPSTNIIGMRPIQPGLTKGEQLLNLVRRFTRKPVDHEQITPAMKEQARVIPNILSQANRLAQKYYAGINDTFDINKKGGIDFLAGKDSTIPGAPTIQDVAARLPLYRRYLNEEQLKVLRELEKDLKPYRQMLDEAGVELGTRTDIMDGGFYIPRGSGLKGGLDEAVSVPKTTSRRGGKRSFEKSSRFDSQAAGIEAGYEYALIDEALEGYASTAGGRALELHIGNYLKTLRDADGKLIGLTPSDLIDPNLRNSFQKLTRQIAARRKTLANQNVRAATMEREARRLENVAKGTGARVAATGARAAEKASPYIQDDLIAARQALAQTVEEAKTFAFQAGQNIQKLRTSKMVLNSTERKLARDIEALENAIRKGNASLEADLAKQAASKRPNLGGLSRTVGAHLKEANRLTATVNKLSVRAEKMAARVDDLIEKGDVLKEMRTAEREALVTARRTERALLQKKQAMANVERELRLLTFEHRRTLRAAGRGGKRLENAQRRAMKTEQELRDFQDDMDEISIAWDKAVDKSRSTPPGFQRIDLPGLQQHSFPAELAAAANKVIAEQGPLRGAGAKWIEGVKGYNRLIIGLNTTADNSALGVHGLLALYSNPKAFNAALGINLRAWAKGGDRVLGRFVFQFDDTARAAGTPSSSEWVADGLHFGGASIGEQQLGEGLAAGLSRLWVIRHANRAFGFFGDALRLELVDDMLRVELARGKTVQQLRNSGELARIADIANTMTGHSHKRAGGSLGDLALFAPKFLQARLSTVTKAAMGLRPGATLDQRIARRSVLKMVGFAVVLTHAINYAQGRDTDMRPWVDGNPNNNFMRARMFGRDVSLLGPWDSIGKAIMLTAMGRPQDALRSLASPVVRQAWDLASGETTVGEQTRESGRGLANLASEETAYYMMKAVSPFSLQDLPEAGKQLAEGDIVEGAFAIGLEGIGLKSGPLGFIDQKEEARRRLFPDVAEEDLNKAQRREILADPAVQKKLEEFDERRPPPDVREVIAMAFDNVDIIKAETEESLRANIDASMDGPDLRNQISKFKQKRFLETNGALKHPVVQEELEKKGANQQVEDILAEMYWSADAPEDPVTGAPDFDKRDAEREAVLRMARDRGIQDSESYITGTGSGTYRGQRYEDPVVREMVERFEADRESVREYLEAGKDVAESQGQLALYRDYLASNDREGFTENNPILVMTLDMIEGRKEQIRTADADLERILYKWGWIDSPKNLLLEIEVALLKKQQGGEVTNRLAIDP